MADGAPPSKRPKTDGDALSYLENSLPNELVPDNPLMSANGSFALNTSQTTTQSMQILAAAPVMSSPAGPNPSHPTVQSHMKLAQLLKSGSNSPNFGKTSPISISSPRSQQQQHNLHPQPSPLSAVQNPMQSPNAGTMSAAWNSMKSPSLARPNSRPGSAVGATPSPRSMSTHGGSVVTAGIGNPAVMSDPSRSMGSAFMPSNVDKLNMANGMNRLNPGMSQMNNIQNGMGMQACVGQTMNQMSGNFVGQSRIRAQVVGHVNTMGLSTNNFVQQPNVNMQVGARLAPVNSNGFNGPLLSRPNSGVMPLGGNAQNHTVGDGSIMGTNGPMKMSDTMQMMNPQANMMKGGMRMPQMRPNMPPMAQSESMQHHPNSQGMMPKGAGHQYLQQTLQMLPNRSSVNSLQQQATGQDQMMNMTARNPSGETSRSASADPEKRRLIQQQLVLLLHAYKCSKKENSGNPTNCTLPHCKTMKDVLNHMNACTQGKSCQVPHCASSRQIIAHWRACNRQDCVVCLPLKTIPSSSVPNAPGAVQLRWQTPVSQNGESSGTANHISNGPLYPDTFHNPMLEPNTSQALSGLPNGISISQVPGIANSVGQGSGTDSNFFHMPRVVREWHKDVKEELRNHLIQKLVQAIFPTPQKVSLTDERMKKLVSFARKVEGDMYNQANSRSEYYHLLAEKIYKIQKELEEKRAMRMRQGQIGQRMPTPDGSAHLDNMGQIRPIASMNSQRFGAPPRMSQVMNGMSTAQNFMPAQGTVGQVSQMDSMMMQFQQARNEIHLQRDGTLPAVDGQNSSMGSTPQFNPMQNSNTAGQDPSVVGDTLEEVFDTQSNLEQGVNTIQQSSSSGFADALRLSASSVDVKPSLQSAQPNLEKLLREPSTLSASSSSLASASYQTAQEPTSLQDVLRGHGPAISASTTTESFVSLASANEPISSKKSMPPPFVNTNAGSDNKDEVLSSASGSFSAAGKSIVKTETGLESDVLANSEKPNDVTFWSSNTATTTIKTEIKKEVHFSAKSPAVSNTPTVSHDPFVKQENMSIGESTATSKAKASKKVFEPLELKVALLPVVEKLYQQEPEAIPFRQPVEPDKLNIPDYFDHVKEPMDLSTIRKNLETGKYKEPWEFIADVWLMFNNAWHYNRRTTRVYKYCSKLKEIFEVEIDPVMQRLGYCCGRKMEFMPMTLCCYGKQLCTIPIGAVYYDYQSRYDYCEKCFNDIPGDKISLGDDPSKPQSVAMIPKNQFEKKTNNDHDPELFETCNACGRKMHRICVLHMSSIWPEGFTCDECLSKRGAQRKPNRYSASRLPQNKLGEHIENRVNSYIKHHDTAGEAGHVHIRVVYSGDKTVEVRSGMKARFVDTKEMPETFPYRAKAFFAFEEIDGVDVCFFGVHIQEYGSDAPRPNRRRVYLSYLDSVHFFRPRHLRTAVYHEILIGYFDYCKNLGYEFAHIWACPPCEGDDYIFHCHPPEQKIPKPKRLQDWYKKMLDKAISEQVIVNYKDIFHQAKEDRLQLARELPYFEGDFWPNVLEESIKEIEQEEEDRKKAEANEQAAAEEALLFKFSPLQSDQGSAGGLKNVNQSKKSKKANIKKSSQRAGKKKVPQVMNDLSDKLYQIMEKHKEVFFVIRLNSVETISKIGPTIDPDSTLQCDLMDGRDAVLTLAREKHYEFSSLRRTKWSTMALLVELHTNGQEKFSYMCNHCKNNVETRYQCTVCNDFDLCISCYRTINHEHKMTKVEFCLDEGTMGSPGTASNTKSSQMPFERCMQSLVHACQCRNANCNMPACFKMKKVVHHSKNCKKMSSNNCPICRQFIALCYYHAKHCQEKKCPVAYCHNIKAKLKEQDRQHRLRDAHLMQRRMKVMSQKSAQQSGPRTPDAAATVAAKPNQSNSKMENFMRKPQPSPMSMVQEMPRGQMGQKPCATKSQGMMSPQDDSGRVGMSQPQLSSSLGNQMVSPAQCQPTQQQYPPTAPMGAIVAAKKAQQLAEQQAKERERLNPLAPVPLPNNSAGIRPMRNPVPRMVSAANPGGSVWGMNVPIRQSISMVPNQPNIAMGTPQSMNSAGSQPSVKNEEALRQMLTLLRQEKQDVGTSGPKHNMDQLMALLKKNPDFMSSMIKRTKQAAVNANLPTQRKQQFIQQNNIMASSMGNMQQQQTMAGMQNVMNQSGMNMQTVQVNAMPQQMQWQQQPQQQPHRMPSQQHQVPFQTPAPPYSQALTQQRMMNVPFQQRMPGQVRLRQMNPQMVMPQGMNRPMPGMQQNMQSQIQHHHNMTAPNGVPPTHSPSQQMMTAGRPGMQPHPMPIAGQAGQSHQGGISQHMVEGMEQSYNVASSQQAMMGSGFSQSVGQGNPVFNAGGGAFSSQVTMNQGIGHMSNPNLNQGNFNG